jgi:hypothetical protein
MAIPVVKTLEDCSDYVKTVEPFWPELLELPNKLLETVQARQSLADLYIGTNPLVSGFAFSVFLGAVFLVVSEINRNYSQVDRMWSVLPTVYIAHFDIWARLAGVPHQRLDAALLWSTVWSVRTSYRLRSHLVDFVLTKPYRRDSPLITLERVDIILALRITGGMFLLWYFNSINSC